MKNILLFLGIAFVFAACVVEQKIAPVAKEPAALLFAGEWVLNKSADYYEGIMRVKNCTDKKCEFDLNTSQYGHTCNADGTIVFISENTAEHVAKGYNGKTDTFFKIGIVFKITEDENMSARYINARSARGFCGMNSTIEGIWTRKS